MPKLTHFEIADILPDVIQPADESLSLRRSEYRAINLDKDNGPLFTYGIWDQDHQVGDLDIAPVSDLGTVAMGFQVYREYWGHRVAARAVRMASDQLLESDELRSITAVVPIGAIAAARSMKIAGFRMVDQIGNDWHFTNMNPWPDKMAEYAKPLTHKPDDDKDEGDLTRLFFHLRGISGSITNSTRPIQIQVESSKKGKLPVTVVKGRKFEKLYTGGTIEIPRGARWMALGHGLISVLSNRGFNPSKIESS